MIYDKGFNPRARTGRDFLDVVDVSLSYPVSIHAPARGATYPKRFHRGQEESFNPRARTGRDANNGGNPLSQKVSIHAPARGATRIGW